MPRDFVKTINAAQMFKLVPTIDTTAGTVTLTAGYTVGIFVEEGGFGVIQGAARSDTASVTVPLTTSLEDVNIQLQGVIAQQESLDPTQGDYILFPS